MTRSWRGMRARAYKVERADRGLRVGRIRLKGLEMRALKLGCLLHTRAWSTQVHIKMPGEMQRRCEEALRNVRGCPEERNTALFRRFVGTCR